MKLENARISLFISGEETTIEIKDNDSSITFCKVTLTPEQLSQALGRLSYTHCIAEVAGIDKLGKKHENKTFEFELPENINKEETEKYCRLAMLREGLEEWVSDNYYNSQSSYFKKDGKSYARVIIRRWI